MDATLDGDRAPSAGSSAGGHGFIRRFCHGDQPTLADCCLAPQLFNARRFEVDLSKCPRLIEIDAGCGALQAFQDAHPSRQPDAAM
ncbi:glutathione S-transferase C-terminal domain-containing protein [Paraburkholderia kirstenboschensis]|uniref:glutathione S-transferase C-terminal domain-containing protein n=1 Tax=Paraburkholderia kirstenboschensis TaxID=1245436 RepID=UPI0039A6F44B